MILSNILDYTLLTFCIGLLGIFLIKRNIIISLMSIELMLLSININFILMSIFLDDNLGYILSLIVVSVAAAESALGLALLVVYFRLKGEIIINTVNKLRG